MMRFVQFIIQFPDEEHVVLLINIFCCFFLNMFLGLSSAERLRRELSAAGSDGERSG